MAEDKNALFFNNIKLVPFCYGKYYCDQKSLREDYIQVGYMGLWEACLKYDPDKGKFSTFAIKFILDNMGQMFRREKKHWNCCEYDVVQENGSVTNILDTIDNGEYDNTMEHIENASMLCSLVDKVKYKNEIMMYFNGYKMEDIAQANGIAKGNAASRCRRMKEKIKQIYEEEMSK